MDESRKRIIVKVGSIQIRVRSLPKTSILITKEQFFRRAGSKIGRKILPENFSIRKGSVLIPKRDEKNPTIKRYMIYSQGIYEAIRARFSTLMRYGLRGENGELQQIRSFIEAVEEIVQALIRYTELSPKDIWGVNQKIAEVIVGLERSRKETKKQAYKFFENSQNLVDSLGRPNPQATSAKISAGKTRLQKREGEIRIISPRIGLWELALVNEKIRIERILRGIERSLSAALRSGHIFKEGALVSEVQIKGLCKCLDLHEDNLSTIDSQPFLFVCVRIIEEFKQAKELICKRQFQKAKKVLKVSLESLRLKILQGRIEKLIFSLDLMIYSKSRKKEQVQNIQKELQQVIQEMSQIDESGFKFKVCEKVLTSLHDALLAFSQNKSLNEVKELIKQASHKI